MTECDKDSYSPKELASLYNFPNNVGEGQTIRILSLGAQFSQSDLPLFCEKFNIRPPTIKTVGEEPILPSSLQSYANYEANLDMQSFSCF
ncbi:hypothetical protein [Marinomonas algicola]|uniref:hypothetical protein n=1 Tax=Marinomonas algicola TaxID=2773454 RepID=UPI00174E0DAF|nr:hypothetical protein [Marinomonas algicola]